MAKRVAVIGGGCSGLAAIKCCLDEGLEPVCFERTDELGGLWHYTEQVKDGQACVMRSTVINTSKEMMCYSDYPIPKEYPNFMHNTYVWQYFQDYAKHFGLTDYIRYNMEVVSVKRAPDFLESGRWLIDTRDHKTGDTSRETFDAVMVCTGHHADKNVPHFAGLSDFQGKVQHSHDYRTAQGLEDKRVVVVGLGNSGVDLAVELSKVSKQVYLSTRRGGWIFNRVDEGSGLPFDLTFSGRLFSTIQSFLPFWLVQQIVMAKLNRKFDHYLYRLAPEDPPLSQHPVVNDDLPNAIITGRVKVMADIKKFTSHGVEFVDGSAEDNIDAVLLATGYIFGFPFVEKEVIDVQQNRLPLFKFCFPPDLQHNTIAFIGCFQPLGAIMPAAELQCRLAARVFKGEAKLPSRSEMWEDIRKKEAAMAQRYVHTQRHTIQVDWVPFMDELANLIGCKPQIGSLFLSDPKLAWTVLMGPVTPYTYRLHGPGSWAGAREAVLTTMDRVRFPFSTKPVPRRFDANLRLLAHLLAIAVVIILMLFIFL
ncbi:dimethylaniline monooxygenase [N-oxide-forming] 5-like [Pomacea canaliculata]|uniref:dimethylaniline monooxygenase [N-oxide-forming] 5-like n=1 Tax=Pomacea canaliculata TaxID=400727 RepID=UPI000D72EB73|nr:dimethylaniline monooxygenase [N-oxide-forming] 5-like [Pomacea canaliculata]